MRLLLPLLILSLLTGGPSLDRTAEAAPREAAPRVHCERPRALRLHRFEDGSAWLRCGARLLVRVTVPG